MTIKQYQRTVNTLDKEIADLEKKKANCDKKVVDAKKKGAGISINKNASASTVASKTRQIAKYENDAIKASTECASIAKKLAEKRKQRNNAAIQLQKEEQKLQKKQEKMSKQMQQFYEEKIESLHADRNLEVRELYDMGNSVLEEPEYDVFVSHAWEDKEEFVDEFVDALAMLNIKVWYDKSQIKWGDSMRERIDDGLKKSKFGVAILSPNYIADNKYWTKTELDGLFQLESVNGKTLLPIWHNLTKQQVMNYSPIIANKKAMTTASMTAQEIAKELLNLIPEK